MSAIAWPPSDPVLDLTREGTRYRRHRHLVSLPTGDAIPEPALPPLRPTRRGGLALLASALLLAAGLGIALATGTSASGADHAVTVRPGETLSEIAVREMPALPMREAVARIAIANDLPSSHVSAGQSLVIPSPDQGPG
jgi:hypothetical protein